MNERRENTLVFLKHLTISTIRKVSATIQAYGLPEYASLLCLHWHQCWYTHDLSMSGNQLPVGNYMVVSYNRYGYVLKNKLNSVEGCSKFSFTTTTLFN
jgi:hypothetical protein